MVCKNYNVENIENIYPLRRLFELKYGAPLRSTVVLSKNRLRLIRTSSHLYEIDDTVVLVENKKDIDTNRITIIGLEYKVNEAMANMESRLKIRLTEIK